MSVRQRLEEMDRTYVELCKQHVHVASGGSPKYTIREAQNAADGPPRFVFSLPGVNTRIEHRNREVIDLLRQRLDHHGLARHVLAARPRLVKK